MCMYTVCYLSKRRWGVECVNTCMQELLIMHYHRVERYKRVGRTHSPPANHNLPLYICVCRVVGVHVQVQCAYASEDVCTCTCACFGVVRVSVCVFGCTCVLVYVCVCV